MSVQKTSKPIMKGGSDTYNAIAPLASKPKAKGGSDTYNAIAPLMKNSKLFKTKSNQAEQATEIAKQIASVKLKI